MSGVRCVADQHDPVILNPVVAVNGGEVDPCGSSDMGRIGQQRVTIEVVLENPSAGFGTFVM